MNELTEVFDWQIFSRIYAFTIHYVKFEEVEISAASEFDTSTAFFGSNMQPNGPCPGPPRNSVFPCISFVALTCGLE